MHVRRVHIARNTTDLCAISRHLASCRVIEQKEWRRANELARLSISKAWRNSATPLARKRSNCCVLLLCLVHRLVHALQESIPIQPTLGIDAHAGADR
jgi:hypothetical protein